MNNGKGREGIAEIPWTDEITYQFKYTDKYETLDKTVYTGKFEQSAPHGLNCCDDYCVKVIQAKPSRVPQQREYYDLVDFKGDHLRQILARNPAAERVVSRLRQDNVVETTADCVIVEPIYLKMEDLFKSCSELHVWERLDVIRQCALGLQELMSEENSIGGRRVIAYRDSKENNTMVEPTADGFRIRLVDFASIRLEGDLEIGAVDVHDLHGLKNTWKNPMSCSNTTLELLPGSPYVVTEKTDIYGMAMILAHFFMKVNGRYANPGSKWAECNGWPNAADQRSANTLEKELPEQLKQAFERSLTDYEPMATWDRTWIESSLRRSGQRIRWEHIPIPGIQKDIRTLFFQATRIEAGKRIDLENFISALDMMIMMCRTGTVKRTPVSVYLFDRSDFKANAEDYKKAAAQWFEQERRAAYEADKPAPHALCVSYRNGILESRLVDLNADTLCQDVLEMEDVLDQITTYNGHRGKNIGVYGLKAAGDFLEQKGNREKYVFSGQVYLFMPDAAGLGRMKPVEIDGAVYDMPKLCRRLSDRLGSGDCNVQAYAVRTSDPAGVSCDWCSVVQKEAAQQDNAVVEPEAENKDDLLDQFYTGPGQCYMRHPDGTKAYVGMTCDYAEEVYNG